MNYSRITSRSKANKYIAEAMKIWQRADKTLREIDPNNGTAKWARALAELKITACGGTILQAKYPSYYKLLFARAEVVVRWKENRKEAQAMLDHFEDEVAKSRLE